MSDAWLGQRERGSLFAIRLIAWIVLNVGYSAGRLLLYPICLYFVLFSVRARRASRDYLDRVLQRPSGMLDLFAHYHCFAATLLDRPYFLTGRFDGYDVRVHGLEIFDRVHASGSGGILMGAHVGSFEVLRSLAAQRDDVTVKVMMFPDNSQRIVSVIDELNPGLAAGVIPLGRPDSVIRARDSLARGEFVGILADRNSRGSKSLTVSFLGGEANFPTGPMMLAGAVDRPVILFFGIYRGRRRYDIYFEEFCSGGPGDLRRDPKRLEQFVRAYAARVEAHCRDAPRNWFNFFDFWDGDGI